VRTSADYIRGELAADGRGGHGSARCARWSQWRRYVRRDGQPVLSRLIRHQRRRQSNQSERRGVALSAAGRHWKVGGPPQ
jgi:hypothetical protein